MARKLRLETLDDRIVPDATPVVPPAGPAAGQTAPSQPVAVTVTVTVTNVVALAIQNGNGNSTGIAVILEKAGDFYVVSYYDATTNLIYTGTDSAATNLAYAATPALDAFMTAFGTAGNRDTLARTAMGVVDLALLPQGVIDGASGGILPVVPRFPYRPDGLLPITMDPMGPFPYNPPPKPTGGTSGIGDINIIRRQLPYDPTRPGSPTLPINPLPPVRGGLWRPIYPNPVDPQRPYPQ